MPLTQFNRTNVAAIQSEILAAVAAVAAKHGIAVKPGAGKFSAKNATLKLELATLGENGQAQTREAEDFTKYAAMFGLKPEHLGKQVRLSNTPYRIIGLRMSAPKRPILLQAVGSTKMVVCPPETVLLALSLSRAA